MYVFWPHSIEHREPLNFCGHGLATYYSVQLAYYAVFALPTGYSTLKVYVQCTQGMCSLEL